MLPPWNLSLVHKVSKKSKTILNILETLWNKLNFVWLLAHHYISRNTLTPMWGQAWGGRVISWPWGLLIKFGGFLNFCMIFCLNHLYDYQFGHFTWRVFYISKHKTNFFKCLEHFFLRIFGCWFQCFKDVATSCAIP